MTSPTVTAVSDERLRELRTFPELTTSEVTISLIDECLRARSALADVGEAAPPWLVDSLEGLACPLDTPELSDGDRHVIRAAIKLLTGKQPRPAAEVKCECGHNWPNHSGHHQECPAYYIESPAAHTALFVPLSLPPAEAEKHAEEVREACRVGAASLRGDLANMARIMGGDYKQRSAWKQIAKHEATLRRLASTAERE